jgi:hypothetical protein
MFQELPVAAIQEEGEARLRSGADDIPFQGFLVVN